MPYLIADGYNVALGSLVALDPQPATPGMLFGRRTHALSSDIIDELPYVPFRYSHFASVAECQAVLTQFGLLTALTNLVSVYVQDRNYDWVIRNGIAIAPEIGPDGSRENYFLRNFTIIVHSLRVQS